MAAKQAPRLRRPARSLVESLRQFLTPAVWKQAHQAWGRPRRGRRWDLQPLVLVLALSAWCCGDSQAERFETAKAVCVRCPVRAQCLDYAVALGIRHGVWGGTTPEERDGRKARRQNRRRGPRTRREAAQALENEAG